VALYRAAQASAFLEGRDFVTPADVAAIAPAVLAHRILLDVDRELRGATADRVVAQLLSTTPLPIPKTA
jgi:MoxR-like ATPase